jgi:transposase-like protein
MMITTTRPPGESAATLDAVAMTLSEVDAAGEAPRAGRSARRSFTADYKRAIVAEYDAAPVGSKGGVLRRERLYDSHVTEWRAQIAAGTLGASRHGPRPGSTSRTAEQAEIAQLRKQVAALEKTVTDRDSQLAQARDALDVLGKGVAFLEALSSRNAS